MPDFAEPLARLIQEFKRLPGIGQKSAQRLAFHVLRGTREDAQRLVEAVLDVKNKLGLCPVCNNISESDLCPFCLDPHRDRAVICVVEEPHSIIPVETTRQFQGLYHVLHGAISPTEGVGAGDVRIKEFLARLNGSGVTEVILATNTNLEGEQTALYLNQTLTPLGIKVTRLARGLPFGTELEYADDVTLTRAFEGRGEL